MGAGREAGNGAAMDYGYLSGAILGTAAGGFLGVVLFYIYVQIRRTPMELLQLRVFQSVKILERALLCLGIGLVGGVFLLLPALLQIPIPQLVYVVAGLPFFALFVYGLAMLVRTFRFPARALP